MRFIFRRTIVATVLYLSLLVTKTNAGDRVYVAQATTVTTMVHVRQAIELTDQRAVRAVTAREQREARAESTQVPGEKLLASDAFMLELSAVNIPSLPAAHIAVR